MVCEMSFSTISSGGSLFGFMFTANLSAVFMLKKQLDCLGDLCWCGDNYAFQIKSWGPLCLTIFIHSVLYLNKYGEQNYYSKLH